MLTEADQREGETGHYQQEGTSPFGGALREPLGSTWRGPEAAHLALVLHDWVLLALMALVWLPFLFISFKLKYF